MKIWIQAARPKTLIASIAPVCMGTVLAHRFDLWIFLATLFTGVLIQVGTNFANDYFDCKKGSDTPLRVGPTRVMASGLVSDIDMRRGMFTVFLLALLCSSYLILKGGWIVSVLMALAVLLAIGYTAGPYALAYLGLGDLFVLICFGVVATGMTTYLQSGVYQPEAFLMGLAPGCFSTAILTINNLRDRITDKEANKRTIPVRFGERTGQIEYLVMMMIPYLVIHNYYPLAALIPSIPLIIAVFKARGPSDYIPVLPRTAVIMVLYTLFFCVGEFL